MLMLPTLLLLFLLDRPRNDLFSADVDAAAATTVAVTAVIAASVLPAIST